MTDAERNPKAKADRISIEMLVAVARALRADPNDRRVTQPIPGIPGYRPAS
ncbi:MAG TPA: hypothetical protein VGL26_03160 [Jatrophihabitans sp.]|jgi:hypothetical protein